MVDFNVQGFGSVKLNKDLVETQPYQWSTAPKYMQGITKCTPRQFMVQNIMDSDGPFTFTIPDIPNQVIDGQSIKALLMLQLETSTGVLAPNYAELSFIPDIGNGLFDSIQISINDESYTELTQEHYPYKSYVEKLLKHSDTAHKRHLASALAMPDGSKFFDSWVHYGSEAAKADKVPADKKRGNFWARSAFALGNGSKFSVVTPLHLDIFQASRYMPPGLKFNLTFHRTPPQFHILSKTADADLVAVANQEYRIKILDFRLEVNYFTLEGPLRTQALQNRQFLVPFNKVVVHRTQFPVGYTTLNFDINRGGGIMPRQLLIGMVDSKAFQGDFTMSPYIFHHYNVKEVGLKINGEHYPIEPLTMDFTENAYHFSHAYDTFLTNIGQNKHDSGCQITLENYPFGNTLFAFDLSNDKSNNYHLFPPKVGSLAVEIKLRSVFTSPLTLLVFACYNKMMTINSGEIEINDI